MKTKYIPKENKKFSIELTEEQIAIIKAGLQYYWLADDYGYALWRTVPMASFGRSDLYYMMAVCEINGELNKKTKVKPDYGVWGKIKRIAKLCKEDYKIAKKEGAEAERRMYGDILLQNTIAEHFNKHGLNGREISNEVMEVFNKKVKEIKIGKEANK